MGGSLENLISVVEKVIEEVPDFYSHKIIIVHSIHGVVGEGDDSCFDVVSRHVLRRLLEKMRYMELKAVIELYNKLNPHSKAAAMAGFTFEAVVHRVLPKSSDTQQVSLNFRDPHLFLSTSSDGPTTKVFFNKAHEHFPRLLVDPKFIHSFLDSQYLHESLQFLFRQDGSLLDDQDPARGEYLIPTKQNHPLFDSLVVLGSGVVWVLQISISNKHGGSKAGVPLLKKVHDVVASFGMTPTFKYAYVMPSDRMDPKSSWSLPDLPDELKGNLYYLPLCLVRLMALE